MQEIMYIKGKYHKGDSMAALICDNYSMLTTMSFFGIPLGVAEKSIEEVCRESEVDANSFLAVVNLLLRQNDNSYKPSLEGIVVRDILKYLRNSHRYYTNNRLPKIRQKLVSVLDSDKISMLILRYFDDYFDEVTSHIHHEEEVVFSHVEKLLNGERDEYSIEDFADNHDNETHESLSEFKDIIIRYYSGNSEDLIGVIHDILSCANNIALHTYIEDELLIPLISKMEE